MMVVLLIDSIKITPIFFSPHTSTYGLHVRSKFAFCSIGMAIPAAIKNASTNKILWFSDQEKAIEK